MMQYYTPCPEKRVYSFSLRNYNKFRHRKKSKKRVIESSQVKSSQVAFDKTSDDRTGAIQYNI